MEFKLPNREDLRSFIMTGNIEHIFDITTIAGVQKVKMLLLPDREDIECHNYADRQCFNPNSLMTREKVYREEVLSHAIMKINDIDLGIKDEDRIAFNREFIGMMQTPIVVRLWECYMQLRELQTLEFGKIEENKLKNSSGSPEN